MNRFTEQIGDSKFSIYLLDCIEGMKQELAPASVDVIITSPPYNLGISYSHYNDKIPRDEYLQWIDSWALNVTRVLQDEGSLFLNIGSKPSDPWVAMDVANVVRQHLVLQNTFHWIKSIYIENYSYGKRHEINVGHYKPINSHRYVNDLHEFVFHFTKTGNVPIDRISIGVPYKDKSNVTRWASAGKDKHCRGNTWYIPYETIQSRIKDRPHPASYPPQLAEMCMKLHGLDKIDLVLDPFMGIGNTAIACKNLKKNFIGFEIDLAYFDVAIKTIKGNEQLSLI